MSSEGHSPSVKRATAYRYGSTAIIIARFIEKENMFLLRRMEQSITAALFLSTKI